MTRAAQQLEALSEELCHDYLEQQSETANKNDLTALFKIGYGLYVVTSNDGKKDNGLIVNTVYAGNRYAEPDRRDHQ